MAGRDENWEIDEFDNSDFIGIMKSYWRVYPKDFSWDKFNSDPDEFAKWEEWLVDRGFNYLYIDFKFKEAALQRTLCWMERSSKSNYQINIIKFIIKFIKCLLTTCPRKMRTQSNPAGSKHKGTRLDTARHMGAASLPCTPTALGASVTYPRKWLTSERNSSACSTSWQEIRPE